MPAKSEFTTLSEVGVFGIREARRSDSVVCRSNSVAGRTSFRARGAGNGLRPARGSNIENNPNVMPCGTGTNGRRSPRLSATAACNNTRPLYAYACTRHSGLTDITNVAGAKAMQNGHVEKTKVAKQLPPATQPTQEYSFVPAEALGRTVQPTADEAPSAPMVVDEVDKANPQNVAEYVADFHNNLFQEEFKFLPRADYMDTQTDINAKMRTILVDWLIEVHMKYRLRNLTLHRTINLTDRYLTRTPVLRKKLQLVGVCAMFIGSKFEEINPPELRDWVYITDNAYTKEDILLMECTMLTTLSFQIMVPVAADFCEGLQRANGCNEIHRDVVHYILELGLLEFRMLQYTPSHTVSAALLLSNELLEHSPVWPSTMVQHSRHCESALYDCKEQLKQLVQADQAGVGGQLQAVHKKYSSAQRHSVANMAFSI